ncbi:LuxR C-terminal-related transcriptional regulator [Streptomyces sp. KL116D]|uniref:LuxR C-terminal-related transcriptional regulator n=1 Tax=Streptomyces sp. KL116D TaxID=3045152 RepID=UPI003556F8E5
MPPPAEARDLDAARSSVSAIDEIVAVGTGWAQVESGDVTAGYATLARLLSAPERCTVLFALVPFAEAAAAVQAAAPPGPDSVCWSGSWAPSPRRTWWWSSPWPRPSWPTTRTRRHGTRVPSPWTCPTGPFLEAALRLAHGRRLRRRYEFTDSRVTLRQAAATFTMMGAEARVTRITAELRASGNGPTRSHRTRPAGRGGGPAQLAGTADRPARRAWAVNRQIGAELGLSPRTIGAYLYRIFPRLGVTSRAQLAGVLGDGSAG